MKLAFVTLAALIAPQAQAASAEFLINVLKNSEVAKLTKGASIKSIEETAVYRCPGCYGLTITQETPVGLQEIKLQTKLDASRNLEVKIAEVSR